MRQVRQMVWNVVTVDGVEKTHAYDVPDTAAVVDLVQFMSESIVNAFSGNAPILHMKNPTVFYNPTHIIRVSVTSLGGTEMERVVEEAERQVGSRPPRRPK